MLKNPTKDKLCELNLQGMTSALEEQLNSTQYDELNFEDRLGLLIDRKRRGQATLRGQVEHFVFKCGSLRLAAG